MKKCLKKMILLAAILDLSLVLSSCLSLPKESSFEKFEKDDAVYEILVGSVSVTKEQLEEIAIEKQMQEILSTMLLQKNAGMESKDAIEEGSELETKTLYLDVEISQRSFLKSVDQINSIYVLYSLKDPNGELVLKKGLYKETKETVLSSTEQFRIAKRIVKNL